MPRAQFSFLPDLNTFLSLERRQGVFVLAFEAGQSIKHLIESAGVPHTEVGSLEANGLSVDFHYLVQNDDQLQISPASAQSGPRPGAARFVLDTHLGRLAAYLRMLGFDVLYYNAYEDETLAHISSTDDRILLTRDRRLLMRRQVQYGYCLRSLDSRQQVVEVLRRFALFDAIVPFQRCPHCNHLLAPVSKEEILDQLEPLTKHYYNEFRRCTACGQIYWKGSHYEHMQRMIDQLRLLGRFYQP